MQVAGFLSFFIVYTQMFVSNANPEYLVEVMNDMFNNLGWTKWEQKEGVRIFERCHDSHEEFRAYDLLTPSMNGRIVTKGNVTLKIRQAYQFLSCKYANVLDAFCEYERGLGTACSRMDDPSESLGCLRTLIEMLKKSDSLVMCMQGSLSCLHEIYPQNNFDIEVFEILENLKNLCRNKTFDRDSIATGDVRSAVAKEVAHVEKEMATAIKRVGAFYNSNCRPIPHEVKWGLTPKHEKDVIWLNETNDPDMAVYIIKKTITNEVIDTFMNSFNENFGFKYNLQSKETVLMYDPYLIQRVERMNEVLSKPAWSVLNSADIKYNGNRVAKELLTIADGKKIVTKANVDDKTQEAHRLLSCKYAVTLKRCCDYATLLWKLYTDHSSNPSTYLDTMIKSEPLISLMRNALFLFYELSPHIEYDKNVYNLLKNFGNAFQIKVNIETSERKNLIRYFEKHMTDISNNLIEFFELNCNTSDNIKRNKVLAENAGVTSSHLKEKFEIEINNLMSSNYEAFGFPFDTTSKINK